MIGREASTLFGQYASLTQAALDDSEALANELATAIAEVEAEHVALCATLSKVYLPELTEAALDAAEKATGFRGFTGRKPLIAMGREEAKLRTRLTQLEADERYIKREHLTGPQGTWTRELAEAKDLLEPWDQDCQRFEVLEGFQELIDIGYDTPAFEERWWQPDYWRHWAAGDRICSALELGDFGDDVLPAYKTAREPRDKWRVEVARIQGNITGVHDHVRMRDEVAYRLENLVSIYLSEAQDLLAKHLLRADEQLLATWAGDNRGLTVHLKRLSGLAAKREMLGEMHQKWLVPTVATMQQNLQKFTLKSAKLARPKKWGIDVPIPAGVEEKLAAQVVRRQKLRDSVRRIRRFDRYERFDLAQPPETWWLHFNDGRRPGVFTPSLRGWYDSRPNVVIIADPSWDPPRPDPIESVGTLADAGDIS